jgi:hypothetical protein
MPRITNPINVLSTSPSPSPSSSPLPASTSSTSTPPREDPLFPPRHNSWADEKEEEIEMGEALRTAAAAAAAQLQEEIDEGLPVATEAEAQAETDEQAPALDGVTEANGEEDAEWQTVGNSRSSRPIFGKFKEWDGGDHAPEASEEEEKEEGPEVSQVNETIEEEDVAGSATASTDSVVLDQEEEGQPSTSTGIDGGEENEVEEEEVEGAPVNAPTEQLTALAKCVMALLQQDPAIITASLSPTNSSSEPVDVSPPDTEGTQSPAAAKEEAAIVEPPNASTDKTWPALPAADPWDDFIARIPEVWSAEQVAAATAATKSSPASPPGKLSYAAVAAVPVSLPTPVKPMSLPTAVKSSSLQGVNKASASTPSTLPPNGSPAASSPPTGTESTAQLSLQVPLQEVLNKKTDEVSEVLDEPVKPSQEAPKKIFVRYGARRRETERAAEEAAAAAAAAAAAVAQASPQDADTESIVTETSQTVAVPKKKRSSGAAQRKARKAKKVAAAGVESSSSQEADVELTDESETGAESLQPPPESVASEAGDETIVSSVIETPESADAGNTAQEVLTDPTPEDSSTPQSLESADHPETAPVEEEVPALESAKKARKNRTNAQRRAAKERAKAAALGPSVRIRGMVITAQCLAWVVVAIFVVCTAAGVASWFIEA